MRARVLSLTVFVLLASCGLPRDVEGTLERVRGGVIRAGITESDPWTVLTDGEPSGVEVTILSDFAETIDAEIEWTLGSEEELFGAMEIHELDVVIGGLTSTSPWAGQVTFTHPYLTTAGVIGWPEGDPIPADIAGHKVVVEKGGRLAGLLQKTDAVSVEVEDLAAARGRAAAIDNWLLDDLDLKDTGVRLDEADHVMAVPHGENDWLVELERYLLTHETEIENRLAEEGDL